VKINHPSNGGWPMHTKFASGSGLGEPPSNNHELIYSRRRKPKPALPIVTIILTFTLLLTVIGLNNLPLSSYRSAGALLSIVFPGADFGQTIAIAFYLFCAIGLAALGRIYRIRRHSFNLHSFWAVIGIWLLSAYSLFDLTPIIYLFFSLSTLVIAIRIAFLDLIASIYSLISIPWFLISALAAAMKII
jgi:hypothetical protein